MEKAQTALEDLIEKLGELSGCEENALCSDEILDILEGVSKGFAEGDAKREKQQLLMRVIKIATHPRIALKANMIKSYEDFMQSEGVRPADFDPAMLFDLLPAVEEAPPPATAEITLGEVEPDDEEMFRARMDVPQPVRGARAGRTFFDEVQARNQALDMEMERQEAIRRAVERVRFAPRPG